MIKTRTIENKPVMYVVSDPKTGQVVLTHRTVHAGIGPSPAPADAGHARVTVLLEQLKVPNAKKLAIEKVDPASWQGKAKTRSQNEN
jgi:hypothetical protein